MLRQRVKAASSPSHGPSASSDLADFPSTLADCSRRMLDRQDGCDVTFAVKGPGDAVETRVCAHRYVLCCRSPVLHRTLQWGAKATADKKFKENDIAVDVFREILRSLCIRKQCRINHVADVANATGLRPQGGLRKSRKFFSARQYTSNLT